MYKIFLIGGCAVLGASVLIRRADWRCHFEGFDDDVSRRVMPKSSSLPMASLSGTNDGAEVSDFDKSISRRYTTVSLIISFGRLVASACRRFLYAHFSAGFMFPFRAGGLTIGSAFRRRIYLNFRCA